MLESSLFTGSENLYKYLVSIGMVFIVLTVYYPLKEKQELEISKIELEGEVKVLNYQIEENLNNLTDIQNRQGNKINVQEQEPEVLSVVIRLNNENHIRHLECEQKYSEIKAKQNHIRLYNILFWIFLPIGVIVTVFGFWRWFIVKKTEDEIVRLNRDKLKRDIDKS